jgi:hypothetical protein
MLLYEITAENPITLNFSGIFPSGNNCSNEIAVPYFRAARREKKISGAGHLVQNHF